MVATATANHANSVCLFAVIHTNQGFSNSFKSDGGRWFNSEMNVFIVCMNNLKSVILKVFA